MFGSFFRKLSAPWCAGVLTIVAVTAVEAADVDIAVLEEQYNLAKTLRGGAVKAQWVGADGLAYSEDNVRETGVWRVDLVTFERRRISDEYALHGGRPASNSEEVYFLADDAGRALNLVTGTTRGLEGAELERATAAQPRPFARRYPQTPDRPIYETPDSDYSLFARVSDGEITLRDANAAEDRTLTENTPAEYIWNPLSFRFSADGKRLAAVGDNFSGLAKLANIDWMADDFAMTPFYYPPAGSKFPQGAISIFDTSSGQRTSLDTGTDNHYLRIDRFSEDGRQLYYFRISRDARRLEYRRYDLKTGVDKTIFEERSKTAINYPYSFSLAPDGAPIHHLSNECAVLWLSERDGWRQLFKCDLVQGGCVKLTREPRRIDKIVGVDADDEAAFLLIQSDAARPYDTHLFRYSLKNGEQTQLTNGPGRRSALVDPTGRYFVETVSSPTTPPKTWLRDRVKARALLLSEARFDDPDRWTPPEPFKVKAADGKTDLYGVLYFPPGFTPSKEYPLIEFIYAGPQVVWTSHSFFQRDSMPRGVAAAGFVVAVLDGRGTPGRSKAFQDYTYGRFGQVEITEHAAALRQIIARKPYLSADKVGVVGTSFGGYFAIRAMLDAPELYRVGVSSAPADLARSHIFSPVEAYLGLESDNPTGYEALRIEPIAANLEGSLMIITGTADANTPFSHALSIMDAFIDAERPVWMVVMPGRNHHFMRENDSRRSLYWLQSIAAFFTEHFAADSRP